MTSADVPAVQLQHLSMKLSFVLGMPANDDTFFLNLNHRDRRIHIESACQLHGAKMTQYGLVHKGLTSVNLAEDLYTKNFEDLL